jgi:hypothetical protein
MEEIVIDAIVEAVIFAVRKDLINCLMDTECCKWSKRKVKKLCKKLQKRQDDMDSIEEAKQTVKQSIAQLSPVNFSESSSTSSIASDNIIPSGKLEDKQFKSIIHKFATKISLI